MQAEEQERIVAHSRFAELRTSNSNYLKNTSAHSGIRSTFADLPSVVGLRIFQIIALRGSKHCSNALLHNSLSCSSLA